MREGLIFGHRSRSWSGFAWVNLLFRKRFNVCKRILLSYFSFKLLDGCSKFHNVDVFHNINAFLLQWNRPISVQYISVFYTYSYFQGHSSFIQVHCPLPNQNNIWCFYFIIYLNVSIFVSCIVYSAFRCLKQHRRPRGTNLTWYSVNVLSSCLWLGFFFSSSSPCSSLHAKNVPVILLSVDTRLACELGVWSVENSRFSGEEQLRMFTPPSLKRH